VGSAVLFDFDDTLVETAVHFDRAKKEFTRLLAGLGLGDEELPEVLNRYDIAEVEAAGGFHRDCFPRALVAVYRYYCRRAGRPVASEVVRTVTALGRAVYDRVPRVRPGAVDLLRALAGRRRLILVTTGDQEVQMKRLAASGLAGWFDAVHVLPVKDEDAYRCIAQTRGLVPERSWMVGNSIRADINPARRVGFRCIFVPHPRTWDYDLEEPVGGHLQADSLAEARRFIEPLAKTRMRMLRTKKFPTAAACPAGDVTPAGGTAP